MEGLKEAKNNISKKGFLDVEVDPSLDLVAAIADGCSYLLDYQGPNYIPIVHPFLNFLVETITRYLGLYQLKNCGRNSFFGFLHRF